MFTTRDSRKLAVAKSPSRRLGDVELRAQLWTALGFFSLLALVVLRPDAQAVTDPEEALLAALWVAAAATALWFTLSLLVVQFADRSRSRFLHRLSKRVAMPLARRLAHGSLALGLVAVPACGSTADGRPEMVLVESGVSVTTSNQQFESNTSMVYDSSTATSLSIPAPVQTTVAASPAETKAPPGPQALAPPGPQVLLQAVPGTEAGQHVIREGENLWSIAKAHLTDSTGMTPTNADVAPYWAQLVEQNRDSLSSGNADLIYPGESIQLPAVPATSTMAG